jgi:hypothetical protein
MCKSPPLAGIFSITEGKISMSRTGWLGREDSNLRMVESKSGGIINNFNARSEYTDELLPSNISYIAARSE